MLVKWKRSIYFAIELSLRESLRFCTRTRSCARANDAKIVRSRDAQCNTKELPKGFSLHGRAQSTYAITKGARIS